MRSLFGSALLVAAFVATGCDAPPPKPKSPAVQGTDTGRKETKSLIAAEAVGYDGVRESVDKVLDNNDQRNKELEKMAQPDGGK